MIHQATLEPSRPRSARRLLTLIGVVSYVVLVLALDVARMRGALPHAVHTALRHLHLTTGPSGFDWFKFVSWLVVPLVCTLPDSLKAEYSIAGSRREWFWLGGVFLGSCLAMTVVATSSELAETYLRGARTDWSHRWHHAQRQLVWTCSWLLGYEFLLRRVLLDRARVLGGFSVLLIATIEFVYHLQKPLLEAIAVFFFSLGLTQWARRRPGSVLPSLAHLCVELVLIAFVAIHGS